MSGYIGVRKVPMLTNGGGIWTIGEQAKFRKDGVWPKVNDPHWSNVVLLLPMTGTNNSTTFADVSASPKTINAYGDAKISTTQSRFGNSSGSFDGDGDYLLLNTSLLAGEAFTIEAWVYLNAVSAAGYLYAQYNVDVDLDNRTIFGIGASRGLLAQKGSSSKTTASLVPLNTWTHIAYTRSSNTINFYIAGVKCADELSLSGDLSAVDGSISAGYNGGWAQGFINGYIQDLRITKNVARYSADFTPPTDYFPTS